MRFSEREKIVEPKGIQYECMDDDLRNSLWNAFYEMFILLYEQIIKSEREDILREIWLSFLKKPFDDFYCPSNKESPKWLRYIFTLGEWHKVYDLLEFTAQSSYLSNKGYRLYINYINNVLKRECAGYRFVDGLITPITSEEEISTIEEAADSKEDDIRAYIHRAIEKLSDRKNPDYRGSIKESIDAVECICSNITGKKKSTLGEAVKKIDDKIEIHPNLKEAMHNLYIYTNRNGIRHPQKNGVKYYEISFAEAKFMLVTCSALCNYLTELQSRQAT